MRPIAIGIIVLGTFGSIGFEKADKSPGPSSDSMALAEWKQVRFSDKHEYYSGLCFSDSNNGWAIGDSGRILRTTDGGDSWQSQNSGTRASLSCVFFANTTYGWGGGASNAIGLSTDGGVSWAWQHPQGESRRTFMALSFINEHEGWIADNYGGILHTDDGGVSWTPQYYGTVGAISSLQFLNSREGWATSSSRNVLHTTDGGKEWATMPLDMSDCARTFTLICTHIFMRDRSKGWVATDASASNYYPSHASIFCTSNSGGNWMCQPVPGEMSIRSVQFVDDSVGWAAGIRGILHTTDGGRSWAYQLEMKDGIFVSIWFLDRYHGWAISFTGSIYRYRTQ
jgi:photosystem II stability/assembly factor-like uncharacterized protein